MVHEYRLKISAGDAIPVDVLVEHIAYALRTGLGRSGPFNVEVTANNGYAQAYAGKDDR